MPCRNAVVWTALMHAYADAGNPEESLRLFNSMREQGCDADCRTLVAAAKACSRVAVKEKNGRTGAFETGNYIRHLCVKNGFEKDEHLAATLIDMYSNLGSMEHARVVFQDLLPTHADVACWNGLIQGYAQNGQGEAALELLSNMEMEGCVPNARSFMAGMKACSELAMKEEGVLVGGKTVKITALEKGMAINVEAARLRCELDIFVGTTLVDMYSKCGSMRDSRTVFDKMLNHNVVTWNALVLGYAENGEAELALELFEKMHVAPDPLSFVAALKACTVLAECEQGKLVADRLVKLESLEKGMRVHAGAFKMRMVSEILVANTLLDMYANCGSLLDARTVFDTMLFHTVISWNVLMLGYVENGEANVALDVFETSGGFCEPNSSTFVAALKACSSLAVQEPGIQVDGKTLKLQSLEKGMSIHSLAADHGYDKDSFVATTLVDVYAKCGGLLDARLVFDKMPVYSVVSWNALILGYAENGEAELALKLIAHMQSEDACCSPNDVTYIIALKACNGLLCEEEEALEADRRRFVKLQSLKKAMAVQEQVAGAGLEPGIPFSNTLLSTFAKCGSVEEARKVFDSMPCRSVVTWTALMQGYVDSGQPELALQLFDAMLMGAEEPNALTLVAAIKACTVLATREVRAKQASEKMCSARASRIHSEASRRGLDLDGSVASSLVDLYVKCGNLAEARKVFDKMAVQDVATWNALVLGYAENGEAELALKLFQQQQCADTQSFVAALKACTALATEEEEEHVKAEALRRVMEIHSRASKSGLGSDIFFASALIETYTKCGSLEDAWKVFEEMSEHDVVSWTVLILGLTESGQGDRALELYVRMQDEGCKPDAQTFVAVLKACCNTGRLQGLKSVHRDVCRSGLENDLIVANCLITAYGKSGSIANSQMVFDSLSTRKDLATWTALINGYSHLCDTQLVLKMFYEMESEGFLADGITFLCILTACSHAGLMDRAELYFEKMSSQEYGVSRGIEHYHCMVDGFARANQLEKAVEMVRGMPFKATAVTWRTVLGACRKWSNAVVGRFAFDALVGLDRADVAGYQLMENLYASQGMWDEHREIETLRRVNCSTSER